MARLSFIPQQFVKVVQATRPDLAQYVVAGIYIAAGASAGVPRAWIVNADDTSGGELTWPKPEGKADSISVDILHNGSVRFVVSAALPGMGGATAQPEAAVVAGVFPPAPGCVDQSARWQANAATGMAHTALDQTAALDVRLDVVEATLASA